jgi:hypothetical protein
MSLAELNDLLVNVRKSHRLLYAYQRRVLDVIRGVSEYFKSDLDHWWSDYGGLDLRWAKPTVFQSASAHLPLSEARFCFSQWKRPQPGRWMLEVGHIVDKSFSQAWRDAGERDPDIRDLSPPEASECVLWLAACVVVKGRAADWWVIWEEAHYPEEKKASDVAGDEKEFVQTRINDPRCEIRVIKRDYGVAAFSSKERLLESCRDFDALLQTHRASAEAASAVPRG